MEDSDGEDDPDSPDQLPEQVEKAGCSKTPTIKSKKRLLENSHSESDSDNSFSDSESNKCQSTIEKVKRSKRQRTHGILETRQNISVKSILKKPPAKKQNIKNSQSKGKQSVKITVKNKQNVKQSKKNCEKK